MVLSIPILRHMMKSARGASRRFARSLLMRISFSDNFNVGCRVRVCVHARLCVFWLVLQLSESERATRYANGSQVSVYRHGHFLDLQGGAFVRSS